MFILKCIYEIMVFFIERGLLWEQYLEINEICWGMYEGQISILDMYLQYKEVMEVWVFGDFDVCLEEVESVWEMGDWLGQFVDMFSQCLEEWIFVCSYGWVMCVLMCILSGKFLWEMDSFKYYNIGLYKVVYELQQYIFLFENDIVYLQYLNIN